MVCNLEGVKFFSTGGEVRYILEDVNVMVSPTSRIVKAMDKKRGMRVMLKVGTKDDIQREVDIYGQLDGTPGLPLIFGWTLPGPAFCFISMEPFPQDLYHYVRNTGPMCLRQACEAARTILSVLSSAHSKLIVHCDIKPQNVVCSPDEFGVGKLAIIDWGLAVKHGMQASRCRFYGTPAFMSVSCLTGNVMHPLDDLESLLYLVQFLHTADLPWGWPDASTAADFKNLEEERRSWTPENSSLREFLMYARNRSSDGPLDYTYLDHLLFNAAGQAGR